MNKVMNIVKGIAMIIAGLGLLLFGISALMGKSNNTKVEDSAAVESTATVEKTEEEGFKELLDDDLYDENGNLKGYYDYHNSLQEILDKLEIGYDPDLHGDHDAYMEALKKELISYAEMHKMSAADIGYNYSDLETITFNALSAMPEPTYEPEVEEVSYDNIYDAREAAKEDYFNELASEEPLFAAYVDASDGYMNMRSEPSLNGAILGQVENGTYVDVYDERVDDRGKTWAYVLLWDDYSGGYYYGWISEVGLTAFPEDFDWSQVS